MPIYEYRCEKCGQFDLLQKITEKPLRKCPTCKGKVTKLMSNTAFQLKGSGWYVTDYANKGKSAKDSKSSDSGSGDSAKSESGASTASSSSETKPAKSDGGSTATPTA